jgi:hypothetical protein
MWMYLGVVLGIAAPVILGCIEYRIERGLDIVMSPREWIANPQWPNTGPRYLVSDKLVDFMPRMLQYTKTAEIMITLASASIVFIPSHLSKQPAFALPMVLLGFAVVWGVCFIAWMSYCYEEALYDPANFGARESSTTFALGFGALGCFALAYLALAIIVAHRIASGGSLT